MGHNRHQRVFATMEVAQWRDRHVEKYIAIDDKRFLGYLLQCCERTCRSKWYLFDNNVERNFERPRLGGECRLQLISQMSSEHANPRYAFPSQNTQLPENDWNASNRKQRLRIRLAVIATARVPSPPATMTQFMCQIR
jgi:hypothetical protein